MPASLAATLIYGKTSVSRHNGIRLAIGENEVALWLNPASSHWL